MLRYPGQSGQTAYKIDIVSVDITFWFDQAKGSHYAKNTNSHHNHTKNINDTVNPDAQKDILFPPNCIYHGQ